MTDLARPLAAYLGQHLQRERGASPHTVKSYVATFRLLAGFLAERRGVRPCKLEIGHLDADGILAFLDHLETGRGNGAGTRNVRLAAIKGFAGYLEFRHPQHLDVAARLRAIPAKKADRPPVDHLTRDEIRAILNAPDGTTRTGLRDRAMLRLAHDAALRVSELVGLPLDGIDHPGLKQVRVMGKGRRGRCLPLWKATGAALRAWLAVRPRGEDRHLFLNSSGAGMTTRGFAKRLAVHAGTAAAKEPAIAGKAAAPHSLRHARALYVLEKTGDIRKVALWLGHASQQTTEIYLRIDPAEKLRILSADEAPGIEPGSFPDAQDELLAMLNEIG